MKKVDKRTVRKARMSGKDQNDAQGLDQIYFFKSFVFISADLLSVSDNGISIHPCIFQGKSSVSPCGTDPFL